MSQNDFVTRLGDRFAAIAGWSYDNRWWVVALSLALFAGSLGLAAQVRSDNSYEAYFVANDPSYLAYADYLDQFGSDEASYILYSAPDVEHGPWNLDVMRKIATLTQALEDETPFIYEVTSLTNAELMVGSEDGIEIRPIEDEFPETQEELLALRDRYLAKPMFVGGIVSHDAKHAAIIIDMDRTSTEPLDQIRLDPDGGDGLDNLYPQVTNNTIEEILARPEYSEIIFHHSGDVPLNAAYNEIIISESGMLNAITAAVVGLLLLFFFRSWVGMIAPVVVVQLSVLATIAFLVLLGWELDMTFGGVPTLLTAIGVAHSVHILSEFQWRFAEYGDRRTALVETMRLVSAPCLLSSITTALGFASMTVAPIKAVSHMGIYSSFGVMAAFFLSLTLLMALLSFGSRTPSARLVASANQPGGGRMRSMLAMIAEFVIRNRNVMVVSFGLVFVLSVVGITRLSVDSNWLNDFSDRVPLKEATIIVDEVMGGVTNLIILFDGGEEGAAKNPEVLREIERIQTWSEQFPIVRKSYSLVDILKDLNQTFHADDPAYYELPESRELVAQYLVLYESAGGSEASSHVTSDYQVASLELRIALASIQETQALVEALRQELDENPLAASSIELTGIGALWLRLMDYIVTSQIRGFMLAFSVISLILCLLFRSLKTGLIAMVPNLSPVLLTLGLMGALGIDLDYSKIMIAAVAMGIAVDDTIHLMTRIRYEFQQCGDYREAIRAGLLDVGRALMITSVALVFGFLVLLLSVLDSQAVQGMLLAGTIVIALFADFLLVPALILLVEPFGPEGERIPVAVPDLSEAA